MTNANKNIVILADYIKSREHIELNDIKEIILQQRGELRAIDSSMATLLQAKHKLKETEALRKKLAQVDANLTQISDWLEDEPVAAGNIAKQKASEDLQKLNTQLLARSERMRKILIDDMAASRYHEQKWLLDPTKFLGLVVIAPVGVTNFVKAFITNKSDTATYIGGATAAVGLYFAFKSQADTLLKKAPAKIRTRLVTARLATQIALKPHHEIKPHAPRDGMGKAKVAMELKR